VRMIPLDCAAVHDAAPELVLGTLDGVERARVLDHLAGCARCREEVAALADTVSDLALLAPDLSPSAGFTDRILARGPALADGADNDEVPAFDGRELHPAAPVEVPVVPLRPRRRRAAALLVAAVALVALTVGVVVRRGPESTGSVAFAAMVAPDGGVMGSVSAAGNGAVAVAVDYPTNWLDYRIEVVRTDGTVAPLGPMTLGDGAWRWAGEVSDPATVDRLRVVRPDGKVTCWGRLPA